MAAAISGFTPTTPTTSSSSGKLGQLSSGDFIKLMIQQLQSQDPMNPSDSNQLLTQMSQISTLQSNTTMVDSLSGLTLQQSIGAGANLINKTVTGIDDNGDSQKGIVTAIKVTNKKVRLSLDNGSELPMENLLQVNTTSATAASSSASLSQLQQLLSSAANQGASTDGTTTTPNSSNISNLASILSMLGLK